MSKKKPLYVPPVLAPLASTDPRALTVQIESLEAAIVTLQSQYEAAKGFLLESERRSADLRKAVRAAVLELRQGDGKTFSEVAAALEAALPPPPVHSYVPTDAELAREDELGRQQAGEGAGK